MTHRPAASDESREPEFFSRQITEARRFFLQLQPPWKESVVVVCGGNEHCTPDYHMAREEFRFLTLEFVARGEGRVIMKNLERPLLPGAVFVYGPGIAHDIRSSVSKPLVKYFVNLAGSRSQQWLARARGVPAPGEIVQSTAPDHVVRLFEELIDAGRRDTPHRSVICRLVAEQMLLRIAETAVPLGTVGTEGFETFESCREWIEANYIGVESLAAIGRACQVDPAYICRLFKRYHHQSPWQFVLHLKMRDAAQRLQSTHLQIRQVAAEFGFEDPFQFSRTFRRVFGLSPRQFIELQRRHG